MDGNHLALVALLMSLGCSGADPECGAGTAAGEQGACEAVAEACEGGHDEDGDGFADCDDQDCWTATACAVVDSDTGTADTGADTDADTDTDTTPIEETGPIEE